MYWSGVQVLQGLLVSDITHTPSKLLKKLWNEKKTKKDRYFIANDENNNPVAVGILTSHNNLGYISGIGSIPLVRGKGYGKMISLHCINKSIKAGNKLHFLVTEKGNYPYDFYKKIGFRPVFESYLCIKK